MTLQDSSRDLRENLQALGQTVARLQNPDVAAASHGYFPSGAATAVALMVEAVAEGGVTLPVR